MNKFHIAMSGIVCITIVMGCCILKGLDGPIVAGGVGFIGTICGYCFGISQKEGDKK